MMPVPISVKAVKNFEIKDNAAIGAVQPQNVGIKLQKIKRTNIQQDVRGQIADTVRVSL